MTHRGRSEPVAHPKKPSGNVQAAHHSLMAGHLGCDKIHNRLMARFYWPDIHTDLHRWCAFCRECQLVNPPATPKAPLRPVPLIETPFERIGMDLLRPLKTIVHGDTDLH